MLYSQNISIVQFYTLTMASSAFKTLTKSSMYLCLMFYSLNLNNKICINALTKFDFVVA